jgi:hypothetical protein
VHTHTHPASSTEETTARGVTNDDLRMSVLILCSVESLQLLGDLCHLVHLGRLECTLLRLENGCTDVSTVVSNQLAVNTKRHTENNRKRGTDDVEEVLQGTHMLGAHLLKICLALLDLEHVLLQTRFDMRELSHPPLLLLLLGHGCSRCCGVWGTTRSRRGSRCLRNGTGCNGHGLRRRLLARCRSLTVSYRLRHSGLLHRHHSSTLQVHRT